MVKMKRDGNGGYVTHDGRWTVKPVTMGSGVTGWAGGRGWSNGHREWEVTDTTGVAIIHKYGNKSQRIVPTVSEARDVISWNDQEEKM